MTEVPGIACRGCCTKLNGLGVTLSGQTIIDKVNLHFHCGEFTIIVGPNGAGKSTLLKAVAGEIPFYGEIQFHRFGSSEGMKPRIGYVPQKLQFDLAAPITVEDLFSLSLSNKPRWLFGDKKARKLTEEALSAVNSLHLVGRKLGHLSGGEIQRVLLSLALSPRPDILLLDEPVSGVDAGGLNIFYSMISELRTRYDLSIVMISHDLSAAARYADRLVFFNKTVLTSGTPAEFLRDERVKDFFGTLMPVVSESVSGNDHHK